LADAGYGTAPPAEAAAGLEAMTAARGLRTVELLLEGPAAPARPAGLEGLESAVPSARISMAELQQLMRDPDVPENVAVQAVSALGATGGDDAIVPLMRVVGRGGSFRRGPRHA